MITREKRTGSTCSRLLGVVMGLFLASGAMAAPLYDAGNPWQLLASGDWAEASHAFQGRGEGRLSDEIRLGQALALLNLPPLTSGSIRGAESILVQLKAETSDREIKAWCEFYEIRIAEWFGPTPDLALIAARYERVLTDYPGTQAGTEAIIKYTLLVAAGAEKLSQSQRDNLAVNLEAIGAASGLNGSSYRWHLMMARFYEQQPKAITTRIDHLRKAENVYGGFEYGHAALLVMIISQEIATGDCETARKYLMQFAGKFPQDPRLHVLDHRLKEATTRSTTQKHPVGH